MEAPEMYSMVKTINLMEELSRLYPE